MPNQAVFILTYSGIHDEEGKKNNVSDPLTGGQRRSGHFLYFFITVHPYQADPNCMTFRACIKLPLDVDGIDASIDSNMQKNHILLNPLGALSR